jgi:hypothetical protein
VSDFDFPNTIAGHAQRAKAAAVGVYQATIERLEPEIAMIDQGAAAASIAISLKRIADSLERIENNAAIASITGPFSASQVGAARGGKP